MTTSDLASELEALAKDATPGPWSWTEDNGPKMPKQWRIAPGVLLADCSSGTPGGDSIDRANAALIVGLRNDLPAILSALRKAGEMEAALDGLAKRTNLSLQADESQVEGDPLEWVVYREHGGRSDREFTEIARAATPLDAARAALKGTST